MEGSLKTGVRNAGPHSSESRPESLGQRPQTQPVFCPHPSSLLMVTLPLGGGRCPSQLLGLGYLGHSQSGLQR